MGSGAGYRPSLRPAADCGAADSSAFGVWCASEPGSWQRKRARASMGGRSLTSLCENEWGSARLRSRFFAELELVSETLRVAPRRNPRLSARDSEGVEAWHKEQPILVP